MTGRPVTHHAIVRWLERVEGLDIESIRKLLAAQGLVASDGLIVNRLRDHGLDIEAVKARILPDQDLAAVRLGAKTIRRGDVKLVIRDGSVVSVLGRGQKPSRRDETRASA